MNAIGSVRFSTLLALAATLGPPAALCAAAPSSGAAYAWGYNFYGSLGNGKTHQSKTPVAVLGLTSGMTAIAAGGYHSLAVRNGAVYSWGENASGELGNGTAVDSRTPVAVPTLSSDVTVVAAGAAHSLAVKKGAIYAWGWNNHGQLGNGTTADSSTPLAVSALSSGVTAVAGGNSHSLAVQGGTAYTWGYNFFGQLGNGGTTSSSTPVAVPTLSSGVSAVAAGYGHSLAVMNGAAYAWGYNDTGQLGDGTTINRSTPAAVLGLSSGVTAVAAGNAHSLAIVNGSVYTWGDNTSGQLGYGIATTGTHPTPAQVDPVNLKNIVAVVAGANSSYALCSDGSLWVWGDNAEGELGLGYTSQHAGPQHLLAPDGYAYTAISSNSDGRFAAAILTQVIPTPTPTLPVVTLTATVPKVMLGSGQAGVFTVTLSAPQSADVAVRYTVKGSAANGTDYVLLTGTRKIKSGKTSKPINVVPLGNLSGATVRAVKLTLAADPAYAVGTAGFVKVKIVAGP